jgi:hypothetical protein
MSFSKPVTSEVLAALPVDMRVKLATWSSNHSKIFDLRVHSMKTCPFLAYTPAYYSLKKDVKKWAAFLYSFYHYKHLEENHCKCGVG